ncbi:Vacuolar protein 8 [Serendipita sp. 399]|nr:Vacuolar protein 8 [Serendipita sp. 399]
MDAQRGASAALGNLSVNDENRLLIVKLGALEYLLPLLDSPNIDVQCNAVGIITNLASHEENKAKIATSRILTPLIRLASSDDMRVQRNAIGALLNLTHTHECRTQLVAADAIPLLASRLSSPDEGVQYYCVTSLSNIAVDSDNRQAMEPISSTMIQKLVELMSSPIARIKSQTALLLRNLANEDKFQADIVEAGGLTPLLRFIRSEDPVLVLSAIGCLHNLSLNSQNVSALMKAGLPESLVELLSDVDNEVQSHTVSTLWNLAASSDEHRSQIVHAGAVQKIKDVVLHVPTNLQGEMTACLALLASNGVPKIELVESGICEILIPLTNSSTMKVQVNSAILLSNLTEKDEQDYPAFNDVWDQPDGGMHTWLHRFMTSQDRVFQKMALGSCIQLLQFGDSELKRNIRESSLLIPVVRQLADTQPPLKGDGEAESLVGGSVVPRGLSLLAQKILDLVD